MDLQFVISRYDRELDRKETLTAAVGLPVTILAVLGGLVVAMAQSFSYEAYGLTLTFGIGLSCDVGATAVCLYSLARNYAGSTYQYLGRLHELDVYRGIIVATGTTPTDGRADFDAEFRERIIEATDMNATANDARMAYIDRANQTLIAVLVATAFCGGIYVLDQILKG